MNPINQVFSDTENYQLSQPSLIPPCNPQDNDILNVSPPGQAVTSNENMYHVTYASQSRSPPVHSTVFFYRPPNDFYHYLINCK